MTSNREKQSFELHPSIIYQLIYSQSGSASKALGELLTNALDARATQCALTLDCSGFKISDDGNGFNGRDQIDRFFKTFGTPHEEGDGSIVGHFRMGRGQIMAWATTHWCSNEFEMLVDVKNRGTDFDLVTHPVSKVKGCAISGTWYEPLSIREVDSTTRELQQMFKYFALPVTLNGKRITTDVATAKWDVVTDEAYIRFTQSGGVQVSNLGMFVKNYPASRFGVNAVVISRVPLQLCMARNEVLEATCKVWAGIKAILTKEGRARAGQESKVRLTESGRSLLIQQFVSGELPFMEFRSAKVIRLANGTWVTPLHLSHQTLTLGAEGDRIADRVQSLKRALVLSPWTLEQFNVESVQELVDLLSRRTEGSPYSHFFRSSKVVDLELLSFGIAGDCAPVPRSKLTLVERAALHALENGMKTLRKRVSRRVREEGVGVGLGLRDVELGDSSVAVAWTDGEKVVCFEREQAVSALAKGIDGCFELMAILVHELCHDTNTAGSHAHDAEFYETYHEAMIENGTNIGGAVQEMFRSYLGYCRRYNIKISGAIKYDADALLNALKLETHSGNEVAPEEVAANSA